MTARMIDYRTIPGVREDWSDLGVIVSADRFTFPHRGAVGLHTGAHAPMYRDPPPPCPPAGALRPLSDFPAWVLPTQAGERAASQVHRHTLIVTPDDLLDDDSPPLPPLVLEDVWGYVRAHARTQILTPAQADGERYGEREYLWTERVVPLLQPIGVRDETGALRVWTAHAAEGRVLPFDVWARICGAHRPSYGRVLASFLRSIEGQTAARQAATHPIARAVGALAVHERRVIVWRCAIVAGSAGPMHGSFFGFARPTLTTTARTGWSVTRVEGER